MTKDPRKKNRFGMEGAIALLALFAIGAYLVLYFAFDSPYAAYPLYVALGVGGGPLVVGLVRKIVALEFSSDLLAGISIVTSILLEEYLAGTLVVLMLSGGNWLERYAIAVASNVLEALAKRAPTMAHRKRESGIEDIDIGAIAVGDPIVIFPHEICPVDGVVIEGNGTMDESFLTGEPFLISKAKGSEVISGSINQDASLTIKASRLAVDSRYAKIMQVMRESEQRRPRMRRLADQLGAWYTPIAVAIAAIAWTWSGEAVRFLAVLVIATPCPLLIAIPVAIIGSISLCARRGILIKDPVALEQLSECRTMVLDKTGTLTYGTPTLTEQNLYREISAKKLLGLVASVERYSKHPLSGAILRKAKEEKIPLSNVAQINEEKGKGLKGVVDGHELLLTSRKQCEKLGLPVHLLPLGGQGLECVILIDGQLTGYYRFRDAPRLDSQPFIHHLPKKHQIAKILLVSGDHAEEVRYLAKQVGITEVYADQSPEDKVRITEEQRRKAKTVFIGDGINDAPALLAATVGIALGHSSEITTEAAGAVVLDNSLAKVDEFLHISGRMRRIALQSAVWGMAFSVLGMLIAACGFLVPVAGAVAQEVIDVFAILNSLRTIKSPRKLSDFPPEGN